MKRGWSTMKRSVLALFLREIKTRFGKYQLGYAWALLEPIGSIGVLLIVFTALGANGYPGISHQLFLINGVVINSLFVEISNRSIKAIEANSALFNYRPIRPIDTVIARSLLELILHIGIYISLIAIYAFAGGTLEIRDTPLLLIVFILMAIFSCSIGILFMLVTDAYSEADKILPLITRPLFFISGVFFSIQVIPDQYTPLLLWNPIFHGIELSREAVAFNYHVPEASLNYLFFSTLLVLTLSLYLYHRQERGLKLR